MDINEALPINKGLKGFANNARKNQTNEEKKIWYDFLNKVNPRFHRQRLIKILMR